MFVLHELENILNSFVSNRVNNRSKITLADIDRVDVEAFNIESKIRLEPVDISQTLAATDPRNHRHLNDISWINDNTQLNPSTDLLFAKSIKSLVLDRLVGMPTRAYPSARLLICDSKSHRLLEKFQHLAGNNSGQQQFLLNRQPYNVTATLLLDDLVDIFDRLGRPLIKTKRDSAGNQVINYDYTIVKQVFPFLRLSDLAIVLEEIGELRLKTYTLDGKRSHQVLQMLTHFARSNQLIELQSIGKSLGQLHPIYNNVCILKSHLVSVDAAPAPAASPAQTPDVINFSRRFIANNHLTPQLAHLSPIAQRVLQLVSQLGWSLESVTFRVGDPTGFSKIFAHILDSTLKYERNNKPEQVSNTNCSTARLLVLDRYFDMQGLLRHADTYGSFLTQEQRAMTRTSVILEDELARELRFEKLTNVLGAILKLTSGNNKLDKNKNRTISSNQSIRAHLDQISEIYKTLQSGYLLLLKLEAFLESMLDKMRNSITSNNNNNNNKLDRRDQLEFSQRFKRIAEAFKQLISLPASSPLQVSDALRFACLLIDAISVHLYLNPDSPELKSLVDLKSEFVYGEQFRLTLKQIADTRGNDLEKLAPPGDDDVLRNDSSYSSYVTSSRLGDSLDVFDAISSERCATRSSLKLEEIMEHFYKRQLDSTSYPSIKFHPQQRAGASNRLITTNNNSATKSNKKIVILMLGSLTHDELNRMKSLEARLTRAHDILTLVCDLIRPDEFIRSL